MKKILFLIHTLGGGGAEIALVNLVNNMDPNKFDITVETMFDGGVNADKLATHIKYISKNAPCPKGVSLITKFISSRVLYKYFIGKEKYDVLIAYMHGLPVKVIAGNKDAKKVAWLHNGNPETSTMFASWLSKKSAFLTYKKCSAIVGVSQSVSDAFASYTGINCNLHTVFNTLDCNAIKEKANHSAPIENDGACVNYISVGRLGKEKGYSRLISVFSDLKTQGYRFKLYILGRGSEEDALKKEISDLSLESEVFLLGYQENPYAYIAKCDVFVCSSFTEGLSTATIEALILGKAVVSTEVSGAREILGDSEYGMIVENSRQGLEFGIKAFLDNTELVGEYSKKAKLRESEFDVEHTVSQAERVIDSV